MKEVLIEQMSGPYATLEKCHDVLERLLNGTAIKGMVMPNTKEVVTYHRPVRRLHPDQLAALKETDKLPALLDNQRFVVVVKGQ